MCVTCTDIDSSEMLHVSPLAEHANPQHPASINRNVAGIS